MECTKRRHSDWIEAQSASWDWGKEYDAVCAVDCDPTVPGYVFDPTQDAKSLVGREFWVVPGISDVN